MGGAESNKHSKIRIARASFLLLSVAIWLKPFWLKSPFRTKYRGLLPPCVGNSALHPAQFPRSFSRFLANSPCSGTYNSGFFASTILGEPAHSCPKADAHAKRASLGRGANCSRGLPLDSRASGCSKGRLHAQRHRQRGLQGCGDSLPPTRITQGKFRQRAALPAPSLESRCTWSTGSSRGPRLAHSNYAISAQLWPPCYQCRL